MSEKNKISPLRFLALGDSYTIGENVSPAERWPIQLSTLLQQEDILLAPPQIIATTGWTTDELLFEITEEKLQGPYALVSLLIGVNNQYRGRSSSEYRQEFILLLKQSIHFAGNRPNHVIVLSIPDWGQTPFAEGRNRIQISREIDLFNQINREESTKAGVWYIDITPISRKGLQEPALITTDQLHPSGQMYQRWVQLVAPIARQILKKTDNLQKNTQKS